MMLLPQMTHCREETRFLNTGERAHEGGGLKRGGMWRETMPRECHRRHLCRCGGAMAVGAFEGTVWCREA